MDRAVAVEFSLSGREREVALLTRELDEARERGSARFAFVHGPAGIGKTYLFRELRRTLVARGVRVFEGRASRDTPRAYGLFSALVPDLIAHLSEAGIPSRTVAELSGRLGPLCGRDGGSAMGLEERRLDLCDAVADLFGLCAVSQPVFLLSDVEAADRASLELLRYTAAAALAPGARTGGLFVISYRDDGTLPDPLRDLVARTPALGLPLSGLDLEGIRNFLARREVAERLLEATGGLPTALEAVVSAPATRPADLFQRRLANLPAPERAALVGLAALGQPATAELLAAVLHRASGSAALDLAQHLDRLSRDHFLEVRAARGEIAWAVPGEPWRKSILASASPEEVRLLHAAAGEEFAARGGDAELIAHHFLAADPAGRGAHEALRAAELLAARSAFDEAAEFYRRALEGLPESEHSAIHGRIAEMMQATGDLVAAMRHVGLARKGATPERARALTAQAATLSLRMGRLSTAERLCRRVLSDGALPAADDAIGLRALVDHAEVLFRSGHHGDAKDLCESGLQAFTAPTVAIGLRNVLGKILLAQGDYPDAEAAFARNAEIAQGAGLSREEAGALINQGVATHRRGDRRAAIGLYRAGLALCGTDRGLAAFALSNLGSLYADSAEFEPAVEHLSRALSAFTRARRAKEVAHAAINLARLHLFLGEIDRAGELCDHAQAVAGEVGDPYLVASAHLVRGEILESRGALADAIAQLTCARDAFESTGSARYIAETALGLARVHLARGDRALARGALECAALDEIASASSTVAAEREMVAGELALVCGELPEAMRRLSRAKEILLQNPDLEGPYRVYHLLARLRAAAGDPQGAAADAARAARLLDELAARVPTASRAAFLRHPRRAAVLSAAAEREITPHQVARALSLESEPEARAHALVGRAPALQKIFKVLDAVARSNATVLIRGESGTGKELLAEAIHKRSARKDMPFVKVNCAAMVEELLMSELFGHEKGAFTGAIRERKGRFELAEGGSIFLDEIGDISPKAQVALLRVLQEREFERVGGTKTLRVDVRVVCATNRDLESMIAQGTFRQDLYYRLKGVMLELPPLRARLEDLGELCDHLLGRIARDRHEEKKALSPEALELLRGYGWPGNVRELENVLSSGAIFASSRVITPQCFESINELAPLIERAASTVEPADDDDDDAPRGPIAPPPPGEALDYFELARRRGISLRDLRNEIETQCILRALAEAHGNISEAARLLQMKRSRLSQIVNADPELRAAVKC